MYPLPHARRRWPSVSAKEPFGDDEISCKRLVRSLLEPLFDVGGYRIGGGGNLAAQVEFSAQPG